MTDNQTNEPVDERWLPIPGFEGYYEVSDYGQVRSVDRRVIGPIRPGQRRTHKGRVLRDYSTTPADRLSDRRMVTLCVDGGRRYMQVHALVMLAFVGPRPAGMQICHGNGDGTDNRLSNLRYGSASDNTFDMVRHGVHNNARKTHCLRGHAFDEANTLIIRNGYRECLTCKRATARRYLERQRLRAASVKTA